MSVILIADKSGGRQRIDFPLMVEVLKGSTITSLADSDSFIEFGVSEDFNLRIEAEGNHLVVTIISTLNPDEIPPVRIKLLGEDEVSTALALETRLRSLRQVYAMNLLAAEGRVNEMAAAVASDPTIDIEQVLLKDDEKLIIRSLGPGSLWATVVTKAKGGGRAALFGIGVLFSEGRDALITYLRGSAAIKAGEAEGIRIKNNNDRVMGIVKALKEFEKIKDPVVRTLVTDQYLESIARVDPEAPKLIEQKRTAGLLPAAC